MNVRQRILYFQNLIIFKSIHGLAPDYLVNIVTMEIEITGVNTRRHDKNLYVPFPDNEFHKTMLFYRGAKSWNELPNDIKDTCEINKFKVLLKRHIKSTMS